MNRFGEKSKTFDFGPKNGPFSSFWAYQEFSIKIENCYFYQLFNAFNQTQFKKNLMNRFTEKFKNVDFGHKNGLFKQFWAKQEFFQKRVL